jgi:hypothetical protein
VTDTLETPRLSGFCSPAGLDGIPHARDHASCQKHIDNGNVARCDCPDGHTPRKDTT